MTTQADGRAADAQARQPGGAQVAEDAVVEVRADPGPVADAAGTTAQRVPVITTLTGIRAVAAAWVVLHHFRDFGFDLFPGLRFLAPVVFSGYLGVEVFFVLSGFILAHNYAARVRDRSTYSRYLIARFARIYPVHLVTLLMMVTIACTSPSPPDLRATPGNIAANVFMLQALPGFAGVNVPAWSICCEAAAYLVFPLLVWWALRLSPRTALTLCGLVLLVGIIGIYLSAHDRPSLNMPVYYPVIWLRISCEFTAGVLMWRWWRRRAVTSRRWDIAAVAALLGTVGWCYLVPFSSPLTFAALPLIVLFVAACASAGGPVGRLLSSRPMQWAGRTSYSLYLGHFVVLVLINRLMPWRNFTDSALVIRIALVLVMVMWLGCSTMFLYHVVEEPARKMILSRYARRRERASARP